MISLAALTAILILLLEYGLLREFARYVSMVWATTFLTGVFLNRHVSLTVAVQVGIVLACLDSISRISALTVAEGHLRVEGAFGEVWRVSPDGLGVFGSVKLVEQYLTAAKAWYWTFWIIGGLIRVHALKEALDYQERRTAFCLACQERSLKHYGGSVPSGAWLRLCVWQYKSALLL